jgi:hypothetical protein
MEKLATSESLLRALRQSADRRPTAREMHAQRISFVMGSLGQKNNATRERVEHVLAEQEGREAT